MWFLIVLSHLQNAPTGSIVLLHACAHNPTGVDPSRDQWKGILAAIQVRILMNIMFFLSIMPYVNKLLHLVT